jgi:uncharacterized protein (DUF697 family)
MSPLPKLPDLWRVLREADLEAIRRDANRPFAVLVAAEALEDARRLAALLGGDGQAVHPWLTPAAPASIEPRRWDAALVLSRAADLASPLAMLRETLVAEQVPVAVAVLGASAGPDLLARPGEVARTGLAALDAAGAAAAGRVLLAAAGPGLRLALARQLPPLRPAAFQELIEETAKANAVYALTAGIAEAAPILNVPLNLADVVVLTKNQLVMSYKIALGAGKSGSARDLIGEVVGVVGSGFLFRQGARQLVGLIPIAGIVPKVAVAYAGTWAIGRAVAAWASEGRKLSADSVRGFYREARVRGRQMAQTLVKEARGLPGRVRLRRRPASTA